MSVMSIQIDDSHKIMLTMLASAKGKSIAGIIKELVENYINENQNVLPEEIMQIPGLSFSEWDNKEDKIYNTLGNEYKNNNWDKQIKEDYRSGKMSTLIDSALDDIEKGKVKGVKSAPDSQWPVESVQFCDSIP